MSKNNDSKLNTGLKYDSDKPRYDLTPFHALHEVVRVLTVGAKKYGDQNWRKVDNLNARYLGASMRHEYAFQCGETEDEETGLHPLAHKICSDMFRLEDEMLKEVGSLGCSYSDVLKPSEQAQEEIQKAGIKSFDFKPGYRNAMPEGIKEDLMIKPKSCSGS